MNNHPWNKRFAARALLGAVLVGTGAPAGALMISPAYTDAAGVFWTADQKAMFNAAIDLWESKITSLGTVAVNVTFNTLGAGTLGIWSGGFSGALSGTDLMPDSSYVTHTITFNKDTIGSMYFDATPESAGDLTSGQYDAFSVALHEIGHMLGFTQGFYLQNLGELTQFDPWGARITGNTFDASGLNVLMESDHAHIATSFSGTYLMEPSLTNGDRRLISDLELRMLSTAYGYSLVPVPAALPLLLSGLGVLGLLRRRARVLLTQVTR